MKTSLLFSILLLFVFATGYSQTGSLAGKAIDKKDNSPVFGASVIVYPAADSTAKNGAKTDFEGNFNFQNLTYGNYIIKIISLGYNDYQSKVNINSAAVNTGDIKLEGIVLKEVVIEGIQSRVQQIGDTTQFNAGAYKTNPDATAEDLVTKMPGVTSENGTVKVHGENVQQVLVDGKPFFGDDPNVALKNMPAEVIDKIQVFDKASDQSEFTGFNDGNTSKTINIVTKAGKNKGQFGKIYAGYGTDDRYSAGGNINLFKGNRRISLIGLSNNINQQNFSSDDLLGLSGGGNSGRGRGGFGGRGGGSSDAGNFLIGQQSGIARTNSIGFNYSNEFGKKVKLSGSYFFNNTNNDNFTLLRREYITSQDSGFLYSENSSANSDNLNHRFNLRFEYNIDSSNSIIVTPRFSLTDNYTETALLGSNMSTEPAEVSRTESNYNAGNFGYNFGSNILYRHKFAKQGRTFSWSIGGDLNDRNGNAKLLSRNWYNYFEDSTYMDQQIHSESGSKSVNTGISYTEPLDSNSQLMFSYAPTFTWSNSNKETFNYNFISKEYSGLDSALSNRFENEYFTHRAGVNYRINKSKYNLNTGLDYQYATLKGSQLYPAAFVVNKDFSNVLPMARFTYKFTKTKNLRLMYRTSTNAPSVNQLQKVIDNSNPLILRTGNPALEQSYSHALSSRYGSSNTAKGTSFLFFLMGNYTQDYIGNATYLAARDSFISENILLNRGSQLSRPENLDGFWSMRTFLTYGRPVIFLKSNLNLNTGFTYNQTPALINQRTNFANNYNFNQGIALGSNISEKIDFTVSYTANYSIVKNTLQKRSDNNYFSQNSSVKLNWIPYKGLVINTSLIHTLYSGLARDIDNDFLLWNASVGYKFFKDKSLEAKVSVYDLLNENNSISRNVTETYIEDSETNVLNRFVMFTLTYNLRKFGANNNTQQENPDEEKRQHRNPNRNMQQGNQGGF
ncbi:MAG: outer membrane beta-barrel protein [Bacteroidia bacterium]